MKHVSIVAGVMALAFLTLSSCGGSRTTDEQCREISNVIANLERERNEAQLVVMALEPKTRESLQENLDYLNEAIAEHDLIENEELALLALTAKFDPPNADIGRLSADEKRAFQKRLRDHYSEVLIKAGTTNEKAARERFAQINNDIDKTKQRSEKLNCSLGPGGANKLADGNANKPGEGNANKVDETANKVGGNANKADGGSGGWAGTWLESRGYETLVISGTGNDISATFNYSVDDSTSGSGQWTSCSISNHPTMTCRFEAQHSDKTKSGKRSGWIKVTLSKISDDITGTLEEDEPTWTYKPGFSKDNVTSEMYKGKVWQLSYKRK